MGFPVAPKSSVSTNLHNALHCAASQTPYGKIVIRKKRWKWWAYRDSNSDGFPHWNLNPARLPISPYAHFLKLFAFYYKKNLISSKI